MHKNGNQPSKQAELLRQALIQRQMENLDGQVRRTCRAQDQFLQIRRRGLAQMAEIIARQIPGDQPASPSGRRPVMDSQQLDAFGRGALVDCLGPAYAKYAGRRVPRIPNGDIKLMSRVMELQGEPGNFNRPASVETEFDVPGDAWFLSGSAYPSIPYSVLMEMALQPCGILSAWMGTMLQSPEIDFYFRNLDGWSELLDDVDLRHKVVTARAELLSSLSTGDTIIQKFRFDLSCAGVPLYRGESSFGYFSPQAMARQLGLDNGQQSRPEMELAAAGVVDIRQYMQPNPHKPGFRLPGGQLQFLNQAAVIERGGRYGQGYVFAAKEIDPQDWFYDCHFYQDPVMPGSLGIEAILQALQAYAVETGLGQEMAAPRFSNPVGTRMNWKYRGQITPAHKRMELEVHVAKIERQGSQIILQADASLWVDNIRIYEVKQAAISLLEG
jgi:3-hydroxymyristoyl/3-hydroxydecanoyl-(acyl carrier protein) dehydratase